MDSNVVIFSEFNSPPVQLSVPNIATSSLFLLSALPTGSEAIIPFFSAISLIPSWQWFFALTPFEAIFLGFIIAQICILNAFGVLPVNLNQWFHGDPAGRKRREAFHTVDARRNIARTMIRTLERLDREKCFLKALCVIQMRDAKKTGTCKLPKDVLTMLSYLRRFGKRRPTDTDGLSVSADFASFAPFQEAVRTGLVIEEFWAGNSGNSTNACEKRYSSCPATSEEIYGYFENISEHYFHV